MGQPCVNGPQCACEQRREQLTAIEQLDVERQLDADGQLARRLVTVWAVVGRRDADGRPLPSWHWAT